ncbi:MAG: zinc metalloprotease HtpX [Gemmatimonadota bacterium]
MNRWKSFVQTGLLLGGLMALLAMLGFMVAGTLGVVWALGLGVVLAGSSQVPPRLFLVLQGARPLPPQQAPGLHGVVEELARRADLDSVPELYTFPSPALNAFTVGSAAAGAAIAFSHSLVRGLHPRELVGVVAHEISHIRNGDTATLSLAAVLTRLTSTFALIGQLLLFLNIPMILAGYTPVSWWLILVLLLAPTLSTLLLLGLSRTREFEADQGAVRLTQDPEGLARALARMDARQRGLLQRLLVPGPRGPGWSLLRTHPSTEERIRRLLGADRIRTTKTRATA